MKFLSTFLFRGIFHLCSASGLSSGGSPPFPKILSILCSPWLMRFPLGGIGMSLGRTKTAVFPSRRASLRLLFFFYYPPPPPLFPVVLDCIHGGGCERSHGVPLPGLSIGPPQLCSAKNCFPFYTPLPFPSPSPPRCFTSLNEGVGCPSAESRLARLKPAF